MGRLRGLPGYPGLPWTAQNAAVNVVLHPERLDTPARWKQPRRIFVNSMGDLFHERVPDEFIAVVFGRMASLQQHTFLVLTKRPERMARLLGQDYFGPPNVWLGVSCEDQRRADERIPLLLQTSAARRFLSLEPLLGPIDLTSFLTCNCPLHGDPWKAPEQHARLCPERARLHWVIVGAESGPHARPMEMAWLRGIVEQCRAAGVPVFVKQDAGPRPGQRGRIPDELWVQEMPQIESARG